MAATGGEWWCLPGGTVEEGEALEEALIREMLEETAVTPVLGKLMYVHQFMFKDKEQLEFFFHITNAKDYLAIDLKKTTHGSNEIEQIDFVNPRTTVILPKFLSQENLKNGSDVILPVKFMSFVGD